MKDLVSNCFLCEEHSLHVAGTEEAQIMQCINCGYVTSTKYIGTKETNEEFQKLGKDMKKWAIQENHRIWIPAIMTLPIGWIYPIDKNKKMKWAFAPMVDVSKEEQKEYPKSKDGGYYDKRIDTENPVIYEKFIDCLSWVNEEMKKSSIKSNTFKSFTSNQDENLDG